MAIRCAESVRKYSQDYELIIVDNGSTFPQVWDCNQYIRFDKNMGISRGWNAGLLLSRGTYKVIIGDDIEVSKGWLEAMRECFENNDCGVANPYVEHLPVGFGIKEDYKWFSGACFMLTQNTIDKVGYFAEHDYFPTDSEDHDYWVRVYKSGLRCYKNFSVKIKHLEGATSSAPHLGGKSRSKNREIFRKKWGFDSVAVFCGNESIYDALGIKEKDY